MAILQELARLYDHRGMRPAGPAPVFRSKISAQWFWTRSADARDPATDGAGQEEQDAVWEITGACCRQARIWVIPGKLWDKTAYVLGIMYIEAKNEQGKKLLSRGQDKFTLVEHQAFCALHRDTLAETRDPALIALRRFCGTWQPHCVADFPDASALVYQNVAFQLGDGQFLYGLSAVQTLLVAQDSDGEGMMCLVSGQDGPVARLHPTIKGVMVA